MKRKYLFLLLLLFIPLIVIWKSAPPTPSPVPQISQNVKLSINYGNGQDATGYQTNFTDNQSALDLLTTLTKTNNIPITVKKYSFGTLVESINNVKNTTSLAWIYFVNGQSASVGADQYIVKAGDKIEWKYIKPSF